MIYRFWYLLFEIRPKGQSESFRSDFKSINHLHLYSTYSLLHTLIRSITREVYTVYNVRLASKLILYVRYMVLNRKYIFFNLVSYYPGYINYYVCVSQCALVQVSLKLFDYNISHKHTRSLTHYRTIILSYSTIKLSTRTVTQTLHF